MRAASIATTATQTFATRALWWLEALALAIGALQYFFADATLERPVLAALALAVLLAGLLSTWMVPALRAPLRQYWVAVGVLAVHVTLFVLATGGLHSTRIALYVIPLTALALAFGRWQRVVALAVVIAALGLVLGTHDPAADPANARVAVGVLSQLAPGIAVALVVALLTGNMQGAAQRIDALAATDQLTGLLNLHSFEEVLQQEHRKAERFGRTYTLVVLDVDNLAQVNELLGLEAGSQVLVGVAAAISRSIRASDVAARLGGDDFVVLLTEASSDIGASIAQRIRNNVYGSTVNVANRQLRTTASLGIANFPKDHLYPKELLMLAQQRMQQDRLLRGARAASS